MCILNIPQGYCTTYDTCFPWLLCFDIQIDLTHIRYGARNIETIQELYYLLCNWWHIVKLVVYTAYKTSPTTRSDWGQDVEIPIFELWCLKYNIFTFLPCILCNPWHSCKCSHGKGYDENPRINGGVLTRRSSNSTWPFCLRPCKISPIFCDLVITEHADNVLCLLSTINKYSIPEASN